jgi:hypothetical protein
MWWFAAYSLVQFPLKIPARKGSQSTRESFLCGITSTTCFKTGAAYSQAQSLNETHHSNQTFAQRESAERRLVLLAHVAQKIFRVQALYPLDIRHSAERAAACAIFMLSV